MKNKNSLIKKIRSSILILIILFFILYNLQFIYSLEEKNSTNNLSFNFDNNSNKCVDLDKNNPYLKSYTFLSDKNNNEIKNTRIWDSCINSSSLNESSCNYHENQISLILNCPYGCEDGICLPPNRDKSSLKPTYSSFCNTNNIQNNSKFFKGKSILRNTTTVYDFSYDSYTEVEDYCKNDKTLIKYFCDNNRLVQQEIKCPNLCKEGTCTVEENSFDFFIDNLSFNKLKDTSRELEAYSLNYCLGFSSEGNKINYSDLLQKIVNVKVEFFTSSKQKNHSQEFWSFSPSIYNDALEGSIPSNPTIFKNRETFYISYNPSSIIKNSKLIYKLDYFISPNEFCFFIIGDKKVFFNNNLYGFSFPNSLLENSVLFDLSDSEKNIIKLVINGDNKIFEENTKNNFKEIIFDPKEEPTFYELNPENSKILSYSNLNLKNECLNGCLLNNVCYPIGFRDDLNYCSGESFSFHLQKNENDKCNNNFECKSNLCLDQKCFENLSLLERILKFFKNFHF